MKCSFCGQTFEGRKRKYCSDRCCVDAHLVKAKEKRIKTMICKVCGKEFNSQREAKYCSQECLKKRPRKRKKNVLIKSIAYTCKYCGKVYHPKSTERNQYCSRECSFAGKAKKCVTCGKPIISIQSDYCSDDCKVKPHICMNCGIEFMGTGTNGYCSDGCRKEMACSKAYNYAKTMHDLNVKPRKCKECGMVFTPEYGAKHRLYCNSGCREKYMRKKHGPLYKENRKRQMQEAFIERVSFKSVYFRDKGICQICGQPVPYDKTPENPMGATIDHIVPLSKGGRHMRSNCQLAHRLCNSIKGNKVPHEV